MPDTYIIDGYNLIHALGMIRKDAGPGGLEASRNHLLQFLAQSFGERASQVTVVFDAKHAPRHLSREQIINGVHVRFAPKGQSADDLIETLIDEYATPKTLVVVSNDARLQNAARRRGAQAWTHEELLDSFEHRTASTGTPPATAEKKDIVSPEEAKKWQSEFADLESDPELKEFFDHDRFE